MFNCIGCKRDREEYQRYYSSDSCWSCARKEKKREWVKKNPDYMKNWRNNNREKYNKYYRDRYANDPVFREKRIVRTLNKEKAHTCVKCSSTQSVEKHHPDYSKPDFTIWLCKLCHAKEHTVCHTVDTV